MEQLGRVLRKLGAGLGVRRVPRGACGVKGGGGCSGDGDVVLILSKCCEEEEREEVFKF